MKTQLTCPAPAALTLQNPDAANASCAPPSSQSRRPVCSKPRSALPSAPPPRPPFNSGPFR
eukprot:12750263-Alexandrium_andersonii.AAC.1